MNTWKSVWMILVAIILGYGVTSCSSDNDDVKLSNTEKELQAVTAEVLKTKKSEKALLLVAFGSTWDAPQETFRKIRKQFAQEFPDRDIYFSFTSVICITKCAAEGTGQYYAPEVWLKALGRAEYKELDIQSLHVIPGEEYLSVQKAAKKAFKIQGKDGLSNTKIYLSGPLLAEEEDVTEVAQILHSKLGKQAENAVVTLMGHGNPETLNYGNGNSRYPMMEAALQKLNPNYFVATVDMEGNFIPDMIERMKKQGKTGMTAYCYPLMVVAGDHANNDMKGGREAKAEAESWRAELTEAGYNCPIENCVLTGLGDYPEVVNVWVKHLKAALKGEPFYDPSAKEE